MKEDRASGKAALDKGLALFNLIARDRGATRLSALAADMQLPRSTLYRLLGALQAAGLIARLSRDYYDIGLPLAATLGGMTSNQQRARLSRPHLRQLARSCGATAHLGILDHDMVTYLVKENASAIPHSVSITRENTQLEAYCSGIGKVLLAWLPPPERARYLAGGPFVPLTPRTITDPQALQETLEDVKARGFARDDGEIVDEIYCLAVPVHAGVETVSAAISLSFSRPPHNRAHDGAYLEKLYDCALKLSQRGYG